MLRKIAVREVYIVQFPFTHNNGIWRSKKTLIFKLLIFCTVNFWYFQIKLVLKINNTPTENTNVLKEQVSTRVIYPINDQGWDMTIRKPTTTK